MPVWSDSTSFLRPAFRFWDISQRLFLKGGCTPKTLAHVFYIVVVCKLFTHLRIYFILSNSFLAAIFFASL